MRQVHLMKSAVLATLMASAASVPAIAQDDGLRIDEIIITAEKREASLQDTAIAITAFDNESMDTLGISGAADIAAYTPAMSFTNFPNKISIHIRNNKFPGESIVFLDFLPGKLHFS